jgi:hypothetical protein
MSVPKTKKTAAAVPVAAPPTPPPATSPPLITSVAQDSTRSTKVELQSAYQSLVTGMQATFAATDTFVINNETYTRDEIVMEIEQYIGAAETTKSDYAVWRASVQTERAVLEQVTPIRAGMLCFFQGRFGKNGPELRTYGFAPRKPAVRTVQSKATALERMEATRTVRGTGGKKQKAKLKGTQVVLVSPPAAQEPAAATVATAAPGAAAAPAAVPPKPGS